MLPEVANESIPRDIREQFVDEEGRMVWFDKLPVQRPKPTLKGGITGHSLKYLAKKAEDEKKLAEKRKARQAELEEEAKEKKQKIAEHEAEIQAEAKQLFEKGLEKFIAPLAQQTEKVYVDMFGPDAAKVMEAQDERVKMLQDEAKGKNEEREGMEREWEERKFVKI